MSVYGNCFSGRKAGEKPKKVKMDTYEVFKFENGSYYVRGESPDCPHVVTKIVSKADALKLANGKNIPLWKVNPATKKKKEEAKQRKKERKERKKAKEKEKKLKEKEKEKKLKEKEKAKKSNKK